MTFGSALLRRAMARGASSPLSGPLPTDASSSRQSQVTPKSGFCSPSYTAGGSGCKRRSTGCYAASGTKRAPPVEHNGVIDYYELLGIDDDATASTIKTAYRRLARECHPDYLGAEGHTICILLNEAYEVLTTPESRNVYNEQLQAALIEAMDDYTGQPYSKWLANGPNGKNWDAGEDRAVFVDECSCIGCKQCLWTAPATYRIEPEYGRSRVFAQWANTEDEIQASIESCPVDCIQWVSKEQLPSLEFVTRFRTKRNDVANMMAGMGSSVDVFAVAQRFLQVRQRQETERKRSVKRSEQQERIRKQAAFALMRKRGGWMADFSDYMETAFNGVMTSVDRTVTSGDTTSQVGFRRREAQPVRRNEATIPVERSLVRLK